MKKTRFWVFLNVVITALCLITACSSGEKMPETAEEIINTVMKRLSGVKELDADLSVQMDMEVLGQTIPIATEGNVKVFKKPIKIRTEIHSDMGNGKTSENVIYMGDEKEEYFAYTKINGTWKKMYITEKTITEKLKSYTSKQSETFLRNLNNFTVVGTEEEEGRNFTVLEGDVPKECLEDLLKGVGLTEQMGMDFSQINQEALGDVIRVSLWVDQEKVSLYRMSVDLTEFMEMAYQNIMASVVDSYTGNLNEEALKKQGIDVGGMGIMVKQCKAEIRYNQTSGVEEFEIPNEVVKAEMLDVPDYEELFGTNDVE